MRSLFLSLFALFLILPAGASTVGEAVRQRRHFIAYLQDRVNTLPDLTRELEKLEQNYRARFGRPAPKTRSAGITFLYPRDFDPLLYPDQITLDQATRLHSLDHQILILQSSGPIIVERQDRVNKLKKLLGK